MEELGQYIFVSPEELTWRDVACLERTLVFYTELKNSSIAFVEKYWTRLYYPLPQEYRLSIFHESNRNQCTILTKNFMDENKIEVIQG